MSSVRIRQLLGKYRVEKRLAQGGYATVYQAFDTIEGVPVALKVPHSHFISKKALDIFRQEVRVNARLDHPNILPIKNAGFVDDVFVIAYPLGSGSLGDRLRKRLSRLRALRYAEQMIEAVAFAHAKRIVHLDLKPENFILFDRDRLRLADFGIARVALRTISTSPLGTVGYAAPEQAMGKPSLRSDVFALGLVLYRMFSGELPEWPYEWPPPGHERLQRSLHPQFIALIRRAIAVDHRERFADGRQMLDAFRRVKSRALKPRGRAGIRLATGNGRVQRDWKEVRIGEFMRRYRSLLDVRSSCEQCGEPVAETVRACPWCGSTREKHRDKTSFPCQCPRCGRGMKLDWRYCPWCYGQAVGPLSTRRFTDRRYAAKCAHRACGGPLMPFMRYCPWCRTKVKRKWPIPPSPAAPRGSEDVDQRCDHCGHGVLREFWAFCPWCARELR
jgi:eukaryotic-like serine/threonine-protein kinase